VDPKIETRKLGTIFVKREGPELSGKNRVFDVEFKQSVARRILNGESVSALHQELQIKRSVLYRWRDAFRKDGAAGLRPIGRPPGAPNPLRPATSPEEAAARRVAELERKIGQQALDIDFLRRAFKRVNESRRRNATPGATASTERSES
jgi:transposase